MASLVRDRLSGWMGNSQPVALGHYLQVQDEDFHRATSERTPLPVQKPVQNRVQHGAARRRDPSHHFPQKAENPVENHRVLLGANRHKSLLNKQMPPVGLEPTTNRLRVCCSAIELRGRWEKYNRETRDRQLSLRAIRKGCDVGVFIGDEVPFGPVIRRDGL